MIRRTVSEVISHTLSLCIPQSSGSHIDAGPDGAVGPNVGHDVGLQVPGPQPSPGRHVHQSKVLGLVVAAGNALEAVHHLLNSSGQ